jgi:hypothetical protein
VQQDSWGLFGAVYRLLFVWIAGFWFVVFVLVVIIEWLLSTTTNWAVFLGPIGKAN